jgi:hypothetical protein
MSVWEHSRLKIFNVGQHPYVHDVRDFIYNNPKLPGVSRINEVIDYIVNVLYPNWIGTYDTPVDLPANPAANSYAVVKDDGDGKSAGYVFSSLDNVSQWIKRYDVDWALEDILAETVSRTSYLYPAKYGMTDKDENGDAVVGAFAGQNIFGGDQDNQNLTLHANSTGVGGAVQVHSDFKPTTNGDISIGDAAHTFFKAYINTIQTGTLKIEPGSISDSSGLIDFKSTGIKTTGTLDAGAFSAASVTTNTLVIAPGSITDTSEEIDFGDTKLKSNKSIAVASGAKVGKHNISDVAITNDDGSVAFGNNHLTTTGDISGAKVSGSSGQLANIKFATSQLEGLSDDLAIKAPNGKKIILQNILDSLDQNVTGALSVTGSVQVDNIKIDSNTISATDNNGNIYISPNGTGKTEISSAVIPSTSGAHSLGNSDKSWTKLWISGAIGGASEIAISDLLALRSNPYRNLAKTTPAETGDTLSFDAVNGVWLAAEPTQVTPDHSALPGVTTGDAGHTQLTMLNGRTGGQTIQGDTEALGNLVLESTANVQKGAVLAKDPLKPFTDASYGGAAWTGTDLGGDTKYFRDIYSKGEHKGLRLENVTMGSLPAASAANKGRAAFATDTNKIIVDVGGTWVATGGASKFVQDTVWNGSETQKDINVSASIADARQAMWALHDNGDSFERVFPDIQAISADTVRIQAGIPLTAGTYRLIGI